MSRRVKIALGCGLALLSLAIAACVFLRIREVRHLEAYREMGRDFPPVWREFAFRKLSVGDSATDLLKRHKPTRTEEFGRYAIYSYYPSGEGSLPMSGVVAIARDGKLLTAEAGSCTWKLTFFETNDPELDKGYEAYMDQKRMKWARRDLDRYATNLVSFYGRHERWPTNLKEFSAFLSSPDLTGTNSWSITLKLEENGSALLGSFRYPEVTRHVERPGGNEELGVFESAVPLGL